MSTGANQEEGEEEEEENADLLQQFQVNVTVIEGRHLAVINANSKIIITLGHHRRTSRSRTLKTDSPYFNEFFFFTFYSPLKVFLDEILHVEIYRVRKFKLDKLIGGFSMELATVWLEPNHLFYHKWAVLTDPHNPAAGVKGYLKCDVAILAKGSRSKPKSHDPGDEIENHLMVPYGEVKDRQRAKFIFSIFRADNFSIGSEFSAPPDPYITITFGGVSRRTRVEKKTETPLWNQELVFVDMIPTLYQYVHINICDASKRSSKRVLGGAQLDLRKISHESEEGFLPTYGPSFLYLYKNFSKFELHSKCCSIDHSCTYVGRLLMALRTEIVDYAEQVYVKKKRTKILTPKRIPPIMESLYFNYKEFVFFASIFDVLLFNRKLIDNKISVRVTIGPGKSTKKRDDQEGEMTKKKKKSKTDTDKSQGKTSMEKKKIESDKNAEISGEINKNVYSLISIDQNKVIEKESITLQNSTPIRRKRKDIIGLPRKGFVYMGKQRKKIRQMKFFRSLNEWPEKLINQKHFAKFRPYNYRSGKASDEKERKKSSEQSQAIAILQQVSASEMTRMSKHHRNVKILTKQKNLRAASKSKYLRIKTLLRRDGKKGRFTSSAHSQTDDENTRNRTKQIQPRILKLKEWTRRKSFSRKRSNEESKISLIRTYKPKRKKHIPVRKMNWETSFKQQEFSRSPKTQLRKIENKSGDVESESQESEKDTTETNDENSIEQSRITRSVYTWLTDFLPKRMDHSESFLKAETDANTEDAKRELYYDRWRRTIKKNSIAQKLYNEPKEGTTDSSDQLKTMKKGKFIPVHKMNWETSFKRQELLSWNAKKMRDRNINQKSETPRTERSSTSSSRKWSPRSGYTWLTSLLYRKQNCNESFSDMEKVLSSREELKHSHSKKISQMLKLLRRKGEKSQIDNTETTAMSLNEPPKLKKGTFMTDRKINMNSSIQQEEYLSGPENKLEKKRRNKSDAFTESETAKTESAERNPKYSSKVWTSLPVKMHNKLSRRSRSKTVSDTSPEYWKRIGDELWSKNAIFSNWPGNRRGKSKNSSRRLHTQRTHSASDHKIKNAESEKSPERKRRWLLTWGNNKNTKCENQFTGKTKYQENCQKYSALSMKKHNNKNVSSGDKSLPLKQMTSSSSYVKSYLSVSDRKRKKVKCVRRSEISKVKSGSDSSDETDFDFGFVRYPWQRRRPHGMMSSATFKRKKKRIRDVKLGKAIQEHFAEPFNCDADDENEESETTSIDSDRLYTRAKRYYKKRSSKREHRGLYMEHDLVAGKAKIRPFEVIKENSLSKENEKMQTEVPIGRQKKYFVFYSLQKEHLGGVSYIKSKSEKFLKNQKKGNAKSTTHSDQELAGEDSKAEKKKLKGGQKNKARKDMKEKKRNMKNNESDSQSNAFDNEKMKKDESSEEKANTYRKRSIEFPTEKEVNVKQESTKATPPQKVNNVLKVQKNKRKQKRDKSSTKSRAEPEDESIPKTKENVLGDRKKKKKKKKKTDIKRDGIVKIESKGFESQNEYFDEKLVSGKSREKSRSRKNKKKGTITKEEKLKKKENWLSRRRNKKKKWKALEEWKISDEESEKVNNEIKHVTAYNDCNTTNLQSVKIIRHYGYNDFSGKFPCLHIVGSWPDARRRIYRTNIIQNSIKTFAAGIREVENELRNENKIEASTKMKNILSNLSKDCKEILRQTECVEQQDTNLWREKKRFYHGEIREIIFRADMAVQRKVLIPEDELNRSYSYLTTIKRFAQDPEESFPDTEIWLLKNKQNVAQHRIRTRKIAYSPVISERGSKSGKIQSVIFRGRDGEIMAKLEMFMWFGLESHFAACRKMLPPGFQHSTRSSSGTGVDIPETLKYENFLFFQCRIYVSQAIILQPFDATGFADSFVRITLDGRYRETQTLMSTLNPIWNEMLVFQDVKIYWPPAYIKDNSIAVTVEVFDFNSTSCPELIGRTVIRPTVNLTNEEYSSPNFQPRFCWKEISNEHNETGKILIASELLEKKLDGETGKPEDGKAVLPIPKNMRPHCVRYRFEVLFWGVRELSKKYVGTRCKAYVALECAGKVLMSPSIKTSSEAANFPGIVQILDLELPQEDEYKPPLIMKLSQMNAIGWEAFTGKCIIPNVKAFFCLAVDEEEKIKKEIAYKKMLEESKKLKEIEEREAREKERKKKKKSAWKFLKLSLLAFRNLLQYSIMITYKNIKSKIAGSYEGVKYSPQEYKVEQITDWWMKYYASKDKPTGTRSAGSLVIYDEELEAQPEFGGFADYIYTFNVTTGKMKKKTDKEICVGKVKAAIKLYRWPLEEHHHETLYGTNIKMGLLKQLPSNSAIKYIVRAYVISCRNLTPKDVFGKSDPYLLLKLGRQKISDRKNYIRKDVNPTFGKCFEFMGTFPKEHLLSIKVMDHDIVTSDDLIGETRIDLESRYYTKHHASCGISMTYNKRGCNFWRDAYRPTELLKLVCKRSNLSEPVYTDSGVIIDEHRFHKVTEDGQDDKIESQALNVLHKWQEIPFRGFHLVPEHIETRALYHPSYPGIEQGKIEMWIDIFPADFRYIPPIIDITPRKPVDMELRVIVWNVENVTLDDTSFFFREKMSDILVEGWLSSLEEDRQSTDVHYRSMNGEGYFNWRFIFPFKYVEAERRMLVPRQDPFSKKAEEMKYPCRLELHVLDNDLFKQDFLGSLNLELSSMPRGAKISTQCNLSMFEETTGKINLFKIRRTRGWWPFRKLLDEESAEYKLAGKVELEMEVLTSAEAVENPVGKGRKEPRGLPYPKRPDTSLFWLTNPIKTFRHIICRKFGKYIALIVVTVLLLLFFGLGIYSIPGYAVKKMFGA